MLERVSYAHESSLYSVLRIAPEPGYDPPGKRLFRSDLVTAVGKVDQPPLDARVRLTGRWTEHKTHGTQFEFDLLEVLPPRGRDGVVKYLASTKFKGIGERLAKRIVDALGDDPFEAILEHPEKLAGVKGLKPAVRETLVAAVLADYGTHKAQSFLREQGLGPLQAAAVTRKLGPEAPARIRSNPYEIATLVPGIGFATADKIAFGLGFGLDDPRRVRAGLLHSLRSASDDGHTCVARAKLEASARELLQQAVGAEAFAEALGELANGREIVVEPDLQAEGGERIYLPWLAHCETELAENLAHLLHAGPLQPLADERTLADAERRLSIELHPLQRDAVLGLLAHPLALLTGGPGVGKTTITRLVVALALGAHAKVLLASPTGRAAKRLSEATGEQAQTIHRMLGYDPVAEGFAHNALNPLEADLVIVDEISMLDVVLAHHMVKAIQPPTRLVLVGDPDQLPSVGPGNVLRDLLASHRVPTYRLTQIFRQAAGSRIVANAHRILAGQDPELPERGDLASDFYFFPADEPAAIAQRLVEVVTKRIPETFGLSWIDDVQVIAPMYRGECGVDALNDRLREELGTGGREVRQGARTWRTGDRVIHVRNDYEKEVFNGDLGRISAVNADDSLVVRFPEREVAYTTGELSDLQPAFAITVHRSQGGEFPAVVMPLSTQHWMMLQRHLLYTAVTRAKRLCVLVGSRRALRMAIDNVDEARRESALAAKLERALASDA